MSTNDDHGTTPAQQVDPQVIENTILRLLREGMPLYWSSPCRDCGAPVWLCATTDAIGFKEPLVTGAQRTESGS
jgi:hypothetical protein